jgi:hypothetical protein
MATINLTAKVYEMLSSGAVWKTAIHTHRLLESESVPHAVVGGIAVCLYGYQRNTIDVDFLIESTDQAVTRDLLQANGYRWLAASAEFVSPDEIPVHFVLSGEPAGKGAEFRLPALNFDKVVTEKDGIPVVQLPRLIEMKIAAGEGSIRRSHKDFADVVELISINGLTKEFARHLHSSVRKTYRVLVDVSWSE